MATLGAWGCCGVAKPAVYRGRVVVFTLAPSCARHASTLISSVHGPTNSPPRAPRSGPQRQPLGCGQTHPHAALHGIDLTVRKKMCRFVDEHEREHEREQHIERFWLPAARVQTRGTTIDLDF